MKNIIPFLLLAFLAGCSHSKSNQAENTTFSFTENTEAKPVAVSSGKAGFRNAEEMVAAGFKRYGVESGTIIFRLDGAMKGSEFLYFDHWGWREAKYEQTKAEVGSYHEKTDAVQYLDGERRYEFDPHTYTAAYFDSPQVQAAAEKYQTKDMVEVGIEMLKKMGGKPAGSGKVQDLDCEIWEIEKYKTTLYMWQGLTLQERSFAGNIPVGRTAVSIEIDKPIPEEKLTLPSGAKITGQ